MLQRELNTADVSRVSGTKILNKKLRSTAASLKSSLSLVLKITVMVGIMYYLYNKGLLDFSRLRDVFVKPSLVVLAFSVVFGTAFLAVYRWRLLLEGQGISLPFPQALRLTFIGMFFNTALPGAVSGDVVKGYYIVKQQPDGKGKSKAFATLLIDRILGVSALIFVSFVAMVLNYQTMMASSTLKPLAGLIFLMMAGVVFFYAFMLVGWGFTKKLNELLKRAPGGVILSKLFEAVKCYENNPGLIFKGFIASLLIHGSIVGLFIALAHALRGFEAVSLSHFFLLAPLGLLVTAIPIAPAGLGTGHAAFYALFNFVNSRSGADLFTAYVAFQIMVSLCGGVVYLRYKHAHPDEDVLNTFGE